ncbi:hypothetical protein [Frankia sp. AgKG'84/4]|uniref:hypothetical protein n=1 Tax=Frankia sp. AgKG'84/4 TaxID=573490 RepID=UPI00200E1A83|nr:hypothetical protein [Frankia sp. AgKG'84/4]MCL9794956.1 hypothetical protein [Frankia sp. AgKG'84/4]
MLDADLRQATGAGPVAGGNSDDLLRAGWEAFTVAIFWTADLHFGHRGLLERGYRPWSTVEEHDGALVDNWNATVGADDTVWVLGDVAMSASKLGPVAGLNGRKILLCGNHDAPWPGHAKPRQHQRYLAAGFAEIRDTFTAWATVGGREVEMSHLPYEGDHTAEERYVEHRPADEGLPLLHGHVHGAWRVRGRQINVGVDVNDYRPVSEEMLAGLVERMNP